MEAPLAGRGGAQGSATADVAYASALETLAAMFADVDVAVIQAVLHAHGGHMEATVETLLAMQPEEDRARERSGAEASAPDAEATLESDEELARRLQAQFDAEDRGHVPMARGYENTGASPAAFEPGGETAPAAHRHDAEADIFDVQPLSDALASVGNAIGQGFTWLGDALADAVADPPQGAHAAEREDGATVQARGTDGDAASVLVHGEATTASGSVGLQRHRAVAATGAGARASGSGSGGGGGEADSKKDQ